MSRWTWMLGALAAAAGWFQDGAPAGERFLTNRASPVSLPLPAGADAYTFAVFGDRTGGPREGLQVLETAVAEVNLLGPDLVMTVGDLIQGYNLPVTWLAEMAEYKAIMNELRMPWFPVAGNHDVYWGDGPGKPPGEHEGDYEAHFGPLWYAFAHRDAWFIALYSDEGDPTTGEKNFQKPECNRMSEAQFRWLAETLEKTKGARHVFLFLHHPRWLGGRYGGDWERVHALLAGAGNVSAVFAGHIHNLRYDGARDGIEYFTLGTTGGGQAGDLPEAGWLHHYFLVTVRGERLEVASLPVGSAKDPRLVTGVVSQTARALTNGFRPRLLSFPRMSAGGGVAGAWTVELSNPGSAALELALEVEAADGRWTLDFAKRELSLPPGERVEIELAGRHPESGLDPAWLLPALRCAARYQAPSLEVPLPLREVELEVGAALLPAPPRPAQEAALELDGRGAHLSVADELLALPDGPFTLEAWARAASLDGYRGFLNKTEGSEFGLHWLDGGQPAFMVHLGGEYREAKAPRPLLRTERWHHLAGVYDGAELRLYVDGHLVAAAAGAGSRRRNALPFLIGADVDARGRPAYAFAGQIDEVRVSTVARYSGPSFAPERRFESDAATSLLLHMDGAVGPWAHDASPISAHPRLRNGARIAAAAP